MLLNVVNDLGQAFAVEIDPTMELENVMALLEAEVRILCATRRNCTERVGVHSQVSPSLSRASRTKAVSLIGQAPQCKNLVSANTAPCSSEEEWRLDPDSAYLLFLENSTRN